MRRRRCPGRAGGLPCAPRNNGLSTETHAGKSKTPTASRQTVRELRRLCGCGVPLLSVRHFLRSIRHISQQYLLRCHTAQVFHMYVLGLLVWLVMYFLSLVVDARLSSNKNTRMIFNDEMKCENARTPQRFLVPARVLIRSRQSGSGLR